MIPFQNPLLQQHLHFPYKKLKAEHVLPAMEWLDEHIDTQLSFIESQTDPPSWDNTMKILEECMATFQRAYSPVEFLLSVKKNPELREACNRSEEIILPLMERIHQSHSIYKKLQALRSSKEFNDFSPQRKRALKLFMERQKYVGAHYDLESRRDFHTLRESIDQLESSYKIQNTLWQESYCAKSQHPRELIGIRKEMLDIFSHNYKAITNEHSTPQHGPWVINLNPLAYKEVLNYAERRGLREIIYEAYWGPSHTKSYENIQVVEDLMEQRKQLAQMIGYQSWAEKFLSSTYVSASLEELCEFLQNFREACTPAARRFYAELCTFKEQHGDRHKLRGWDYPYWRTKLATQRYSSHVDAASEYLPFGQVLKGLFDLISRIFSLHLVPLEVDPECLWHEDVLSFELRENQSDQLRAWLFIDPYERSSDKMSPHPVNLTCPHHHIDAQGKRHLPTGYISCHFTPPSETQETLLTWSDATHLFNQTGAILLDLLSTSEVASASGAKGLGEDKRRIFSKFMEYWLYHTPTVQGFAKHYKTGEVLPHEMIQNLKKYNDFHLPYEFITDIKFSMADIMIHSTYTPHSNIVEFCRKIFKRQHESEPMVAESQERFVCNSFDVINPRSTNNEARSSGHYRNLWSQMMAAYAFRQFEKEDHLDEKAMKNLGSAFLHALFSLETTAHAPDMTRRFASVGDAATIDALLHLHGMKP